MLVKCQLGMQAELVQEFSLRLQISPMPSEKNRADALTKLRKMWLNGLEKPEGAAVAVASLQTLDIQELHNLHQMGGRKNIVLSKTID